jgi:hypothetical protein
MSFLRHRLYAHILEQKHEPLAPFNSKPDSTDSGSLRCPQCGLACSRIIPHTPFCTTEVQFSMLGGLASVAGGARNHAEWLTGRGVAQNEATPLHYAASNDHEAAIKALVAAKADVDATDEVRVGEGKCLEGEGGASWGFCVTVLVWSLTLRLLQDPSREPWTQPSTQDPCPCPSTPNPKPQTREP